jgi:hypothetical protein
MRRAAFTVTGERTLSSFEFILVLISIVAGFAVSEILAGWGRLIRERVSPRATGLYLAASLMLLTLIVRYVWLLWGLREMNWQFLGFVLAFSPILVLALAAYVTSPARTLHFDPETHYFDQARPLYYLEALFFILWSLGDSGRLAYYEAVGFFDADTSVFAGSLAGRLVVVGMLVWLAHTRRRFVHWVVIVFLLIAIAFVSFRVIPEL